MPFKLSIVLFNLFTKPISFLYVMLSQVSYRSEIIVLLCLGSAGFPKRSYNPVDFMHRLNSVIALLKLFLL